MEERIWNLEEILANDNFILDEDGEVEVNGEYIVTEMMGKSVKWCLEEGWNVEDWMIANIDYKKRRIDKLHEFLSNYTTEEIENYLKTI